MYGSSKPPPVFAFQFCIETKMFFRQRQREWPKTAYDCLPRFFILLPALNKKAKEVDMMTQPLVREVQSSENLTLPFNYI
jgi:hypothetical protein